MRASLENTRLFDSLLSGRNRLHTVSQTITGAFTVQADSPPFIVLSAAAAQDVTLPAVRKGAMFVITASGAGALTVKNAAAATVSVVDAGQTGIFVSDGTSWFAHVAGGAASTGLKIARGVDAVTGTLTKATGLALVVAVVATSQDDMDGIALAAVSATVGNQAGAPAAGSVILKCWKVTSSANPTLIAATAAKNVNWIAVGA